jgi:hypothetical protein
MRLQFIALSRGWRNRPFAGGYAASLPRLALDLRNPLGPRSRCCHLGCRCCILVPAPLPRHSHARNYPCPSTIGMSPLLPSFFALRHFPQRRLMAVPVAFRAQTQFVWRTFAFFPAGPRTDFSRSQSSNSLRHRSGDHAEPLLHGSSPSSTQRHPINLPAGCNHSPPPASPPSSPAAADPGSLIADS